MPYKTILTFVNIASCYYSIYKYAKYFAKRHPKVIEDEKAVGIVLKLQEEANSRPGTAKKTRHPKNHERSLATHRSRRITVTAMGTPGALLQESQPDLSGTGVGVYDFAREPPVHPEAPSVIETVITD